MADDQKYDEIETLLTEGVAEEDQTPEKVEPEEADESQEPDNEVEAEPETELEDEVVDIDYELRVPMPDGRDAMTVGEMKDAINGSLRDQQEFEAGRMKLIADEERLSKFMKESGVEIPPSFNEHIQKQQTEYLQEQHGLMMRMMPEMEDKTAFSKMREAIVETAARSNFTESEMSQITDARVVHLINRLATLEAEKARATENVAQIKKKSGPKGVVKRHKSSQSNIDRQVDNAINSGDTEVKAAAIEALLSG